MNDVKNCSPWNLMTILTCAGLLSYCAILGSSGFLQVYDYPVLAFSLLIWFLGMIGVSQRHEVARKLVIIVSFFICLYLMTGIGTFLPMKIEWIAIFAVVGAYYSLPSIRMEFGRGCSSYSSRKRVLVVDDDKGLLKVLRLHLMKNGMDVLTANTGEKGLNLAKKKKLDIIILDVILPGLKGRAVCAKLKADPATRNIPVIFLTAKDSPDDVKAEMDAGALSHLTKPVDPQKLISEIKRVLG